MPTRMLTLPEVGAKVYIVEDAYRTTNGYDAVVTKVTPSGQITTVVKFPDGVRADLVLRWFEPTWGSQWRRVGDSGFNADWRLLTDPLVFDLERAKVKRARNKQRSINELRARAAQLKEAIEHPTFYNRIPDDKEMAEIEAAYALLGKAIGLSNQERALVAAEKAEKTNAKA